MEELPTSKLPLPDSPELNSLVTRKLLRRIYRVLYENQHTSLNIAQIREKLGLEAGEQSDLGRRTRDLDQWFVVERTGHGSSTVYVLTGMRLEPLASRGISKKERALVLSDGRCAYCGRSPLKHGVELHVDHKIPLDWGGSNERDNLQPLCSECNEGKKNLWADYDQYKDKIQGIISHENPYKRIGELLKAFNGEPVPDDLIEMVAKTGQYQKDWTRRLRELKDLGWKYSYEKKKIGGRFRTFYTLEHHEPWPEDIRAVITQREAQRKSEKELLAQ